ncbi:DNA-binding MurR/RpiR family transcriptional regulator [Skermanella aerolata]|uniref:hypothetical protein n=1 Tax=Skermanella aerolata TaxID=393310 RepID=UPI003D2185FD
MTKKHPTIEHRLAFKIMWGVSTKRTHSVEDIAAMFGVSIPTIMRACESTPRFDEGFRGYDQLRPSWEEDRRDKGLPIDDKSWALSLGQASAHLEQCQVRLSERLTQTLARAQARTHHLTS